ncbi:MAG: hypothetical protein JSU72_12115 [Deltaproteobacteria bacterium]|nr:MAG: hypothetical protein JSU72_12115 [Deltaproteobacteria bacterium]
MFTRVNPLVTIIALLGVISSTVYLFHAEFGRIVRVIFSPRTPITGTHLFLCQFMILSGLYLLAVYLTFKLSNEFGRRRSLLLVILLFGVFFRLCLVRTSPELSSDIYRYVWDGRVQARGINPYLHPPSSESLSSLRDEAIYPHINRKPYPTIYPAGAQIFFLLAFKIVGDSPQGFKAILIFFDLLTMVVLIAFLKGFRVEKARFIVYAWNPLVIFEIAHSGHLEGLMVFLVVLAWFLHSTNRRTLGVLSLACASATKIYPALLLPTFINRGERIRVLSVFLGSILILHLPYLSAGRKIVGFLPVYLKSPYESFNLGLKYFLMRTFPSSDHFFLTKIFVGIVLAVSLAVFFKQKDKKAVLKYSYILISMQLIFVPAALHPWYVVWLIPLLAFYPSPGWLIFSGTVALSYLKYVKGIMPTWVLWLEYLPLYGLLIMEYLWRQRASQNWFLWRPKVTNWLGKV